MKPIVLIIVLSLCLARPIYSQLKPDSKHDLTELDLSPNQRSAMQAAILEYRHNERMRKEQLRAKLFQILNRRQQATIMHWRRIHR